MTSLRPHHPLALTCYDGNTAALLWWLCYTYSTYVKMVDTLTVGRGEREDVVVIFLWFRFIHSMFHSMIGRNEKLTEDIIFVAFQTRWKMERVKKVGEILYQQWFMYWIIVLYQQVLVLISYSFRLPPFPGAELSFPISISRL